MFSYSGLSKEEKQERIERMYFEIFGLDYYISKIPPKHDFKDIRSRLANLEVKNKEMKYENEKLKAIVNELVDYVYSRDEHE